MQITTEKKNGENYDYTIYRTEVRGRRFEIIHNETLDVWTVFAKAKGAAHPGYGKSFRSLAGVEDHYTSLRGIRALIEDAPVELTDEQTGGNPFK